MPPSRPRGALRRDLLATAVEAIEELGVTAMTLRDVARRAGVTHTAVGYHFGDKTGLLTAIAAEGFDLLADALDAARASFLEMGVAYVRFALTHRAHFEVMYQPSLHHPADEALRAARRRTADLLYGSTDATDEDTLTGVAAWSIVHGFAVLWLNGNIPVRLGDDPDALAREVARRLRVPPHRRS
jgi:AcrR family transcriptional regulator